MGTIDMMTDKISTGADFCDLGEVAGRRQLFKVNEGVNSREALQWADDLLSAVDEQVYNAAMGVEPLKDNPAWLAYHGLKSARAVVQSIIFQLEDAQLANQESAGK